MFRELPVIAILVLAMAGCGAGSGASESAGGADEAAAEASAQVSSTPAVETSSSAPATETSAAEEATPVETPAAVDKDMAEAETRKAEAVKTSKPAVDTSQLRDAPEWQMRDLDGNIVKKEDYLGQVVLVDFWATWCGPCKRSIPHLMALEEEYKDKGFSVVGVSLDQQGPRVVKPYVDHYKINYEIVMGTQQHAVDFGGVRGIPTAFIISQDGKIYRKIVGLVPKAQYERDIKKLLGLS